MNDCILIMIVCLGLERNSVIKAGSICLGSNRFSIDLFIGYAIAGISVKPSPVLSNGLDVKVIAIAFTVFLWDVLSTSNIWLLLNKTRENALRNRIVTNRAHITEEISGNVKVVLRQYLIVICCFLFHSLTRLIAWHFLGLKQYY